MILDHLNNLFLLRAQHLKLSVVMQSSAFVLVDSNRGIAAFLMSHKDFYPIFTV